MEKKEEQGEISKDRPTDSKKTYPLPKSLMEIGDIGKPKTIVLTLLYKYGKDGNPRRIAKEVNHAKSTIIQHLWELRELNLVRKGTNNKAEYGDCWAVTDLGKEYLEKKVFDNSKDRKQKKVDKMVDKSIHSPIIKSLTKAEKEIIRLIFEEKLTRKQIEIRRQCKRQAVSKLISSLRRKGALKLESVGLKLVDSLPSTCQPNNSAQVRLHGQEFRIKLLLQAEEYRNSLNDSNIIYLDGHTIKLYKNVIEIYAGEGTSFFGDDENEADSKSASYWRTFFRKLEYSIKVIIVKEGCRNIKEVNHHYARGNSEICYNNLEKEGKKIRVLDPIDGKGWLITDESFGDKEDETIHPETAKPDRGTIDRYLNDWRSNKPPTNSELLMELKDSKEIIKRVSENNLQLSQTLEQISNNQIKLTTEFAKLKYTKDR